MKTALSRLSRPIIIFGSRARNLSFYEMILLLFNALFKIDNIIIYVKELDSGVDKKRYNHDSNIVKGDLSDIVEIRKKMSNPPWELCCDLYDGPMEFFTYKDGSGAIGHISWIYKKNDPNRIIYLCDNEAEIKYALTFEPCRGKGLYPATLIKIQRYLKEKGYKRVFIGVNEDNTSSIRGIQKAGFNFASRIKLIKVMGIQINRKFSSKDMKPK